MINFSLDARRGSFHLQVECTFATDWTVIFGPSGAGKSTLLRLLAGLDQPISGRIALDGRALTETATGLRIPPGHRQTSLVSQQPALFPHLTAAANVAYGLRNLDRAARARRVDEMLDLVGATDLAARRPQDLSGGQAQRVALARALAPAPRLLLLDEPFSALDGVASDALLVRLQPGCARIAFKPSWPLMTRRTRSLPRLKFCFCATAASPPSVQPPRSSLSERDRLLSRLQLPRG